MLHYSELFGLPRQSLRTHSDTLKLIKQTLRDVESVYKDIGGSVMKYDEIQENCRESWSEKFNYLCIDMTRKEKKVEYRISNESKNTIIECIPESDSFSFLIVISN